MKGGLRFLACLLLACGLVGCGLSAGVNVTWLTRGAVTGSGVGNSAASHLAWTTTPSSALNYYVYRSITPNTGFALIGTTSGRFFIDADVDSGKIYYYRVASVSGNPEVDPPQPNQGRTTAIVTDPCFTKTALRVLKSLQSIADLRSAATTLYSQCAASLHARLTLPSTMTPFNDSEVQMIFSMMVAHVLAPYGNETPNQDLLDLLAENTLACDSYAALAGHVYQLVAGDNYTDQIYFAGFNGGAVGNHAQMIFVSSLRQMLLDPTTGLVALIDYQSLLNGVPAKKVFSFYGYWGDPEQNAIGIEDFYWTVFNAILDGAYRPADALYLSPRVIDFNASINEMERVTIPP